MVMCHATTFGRVLVARLTETNLGSRRQLAQSRSVNIEEAYTMPELHRATDGHPSFLRRGMRGLAITHLEELPLIDLHVSIRGAFGLVNGRIAGPVSDRCVPCTE